MAVALNATGGAQTGTTSLTITGCARTDGDFMLLWIHHKGSGAPLGVTGAGWTLGPTVLTSSGSLYLYFKYATATGTESNVTATNLTSSSVGSMASFSGVDANSPFIREFGTNKRWRTQANSEGTYGVPSTTTNLFDWESGDAAVAIIGYDNDASTAWTFANLYRSGGSDLTGFMTEIADGLTTGGTDCGGAWAYCATAGDYLRGFAPVPTEGSAGTADNGNILVVLRAAITPAASSTITDNFNDNSIAAQWYTSVEGTGAVNETNARMELSTASGGGTDYSALISTSRYSLDSLTVKLPVLPDNGHVFLLLLDGDTFLGTSSLGSFGLDWDMTAGLLYRQIFADDSTSSLSTTYTSTEWATAKYLKITWDGSTIRFYYGDGSTWTLITTYGHNGSASSYFGTGFDPGNVRIVLGWSYNGTGKAYFDDLNITTTMTAVGKDLQLIWNVNQPPVGKNLQLIWNDKALVNKSLQIVWNDLVPVNKSLQLVWNVRSVVGKALGLVWNTIATVGKSLQTVWNTRAVIAKSLQLVWNDLVPINKSLQLVWNTRAVAGKDLQLVWNTQVTSTSAVGKDLQLIWNLAAPVGKSNQLVWNTRANVNKDLQLIWNDRALIWKDLQLVWNDKATVGKNLALVWNVIAPVGKSLQVVWNTRAIIGKSSQFVWNVNTFVGKDLQIIWNDRAVVGKSAQFIWNVLTNGIQVGNNLGLVWNVRAPVGKNLQVIWNIRRIVWGGAPGPIPLPGIETTFDTGIGSWVAAPGTNATVTWDSTNQRIVITRNAILNFPIAKIDSLNIDVRGQRFLTIDIDALRVAGADRPFYILVQQTAGPSSSNFVMLTSSSLTHYQFQIDVTSLQTINYIEMGWNTTAGGIGEHIDVDNLQISGITPYLSLLWNVRTPVGKNLQLVWNTTGPIGKDLSLRWNTRSVTGKALQLLWTVNTKATKDLTLRWNILTFVGKSLSPIWNIRAAVGKDLSLYWNVLFTFTWTDIIYDSDIWTDTVFDSDVYTQYDPGTDIWTDVVPPGTVWS